MSFAQDIMLKDFLAGAASALQKAQSGEVPSEKGVRDIPARTITMEDANGRKKELALPASQVKQYMYRLGSHDVLIESDDYEECVITPSREALDKLAKADRAVLEKVSIYSESFATGESAPVLVVPPALQQQAEKLLQKAGVTPSLIRIDPYAEGKYSVRQDHTDSGEAMSVFNFGWDTFKHIGEALGTGASVGGNEVGNKR